MKDVNEKKLNKEVIFKLLPEFSNFSVNLEIFSEIGSTNSYLLNKDLQENKLSICLSEKQNLGRGRNGKIWQSPKNKNIYLSLSFITDLPVKKLEGFSLFVGLSISKAIKKLYSINALIKWPNDLFLNGKKFGGILIETKNIEGKILIVIGIGLNVLMEQNKFIDQSWTSIKIENRNLNIDRNELVAAIVSETMMNLEIFKLNGFKYFKKEFEYLHLLQNQKVIASNYPDEKCIALNINNDGSLNLKIGNKKYKVSSGEVSLKIQK
jgi:BirA family biotin operon repressor/biotin-[acetyl-CoA-carboxylase] ligase|tara:strand:- start:30 stop:827 length:798 start_codon:yes stop_codon:yes gene_type:complete